MVYSGDGYGTREKTIIDAATADEARKKVIASWHGRCFVLCVDELAG
jgi:hypothetical protein